MVIPQGRQTSLIKKRKKTAPTSTRTSFSGNTEELDDCTFNVGLANQGEIFTKYLKKLAEYAGRNYKESRDISYAIEMLQKRILVLTSQHWERQEVKM